MYVNKDQAVRFGLAWFPVSCERGVMGKGEGVRGRGKKKKGDGRRGEV